MPLDRLPLSFYPCYQGSPIDSSSAAPCRLRCCTPPASLPCPPLLAGGACTHQKSALSALVIVGPLCSSVVRVVSPGSMPCASTPPATCVTCQWQPAAGPGRLFPAGNAPGRQRIAARPHGSTWVSMPYCQFLQQGDTILCIPRFCTLFFEFFLESFSPRAVFLCRQGVTTLEKSLVFSMPFKMCSGVFQRFLVVRVILYYFYRTIICWNTLEHILKTQKITTSFYITSRPGIPRPPPGARLSRAALAGIPVSSK